jgi:hypothetical protein
MQRRELRFRDQFVADIEEMVVTQHLLEIHILTNRLAVCRLPSGSPVPTWASGNFIAVVQTAHETSIVCDKEVVPVDVQCQPGWAALMVVGPLDFALTGVLAAIAVPLADAGVSIFAVSTFDTDYILIPIDRLAIAVRTLSDAGHRVVTPD